MRLANLPGRVQEIQCALHVYRRINQGIGHTVTHRGHGSNVRNGIGLVLLAHMVPHSDLLLPVSIGLAVAVALGVGLIVAQRGSGTRLFSALALRIAGSTGQGAADNFERLQATLDDAVKRLEDM